MRWVPLESVPKTLFKGCSSLVNLTIQNSFITELPEELFSDTKKIKLIDFSGNNIETLPAGIFKDLGEVESLRFIKNKLTQLDSNQFFHQRSLKIVHFQENLLNNLPYDLFSPTKKLEELDLSHNKIELKARKIFTGGSTFDNLKIFNIANNKLTYIPEELTYNMLKVKVFNMSRNKIGEDGGGALKPDDINFLQRTNMLLDLSFNRIGRFLLHDERWATANTTSFHNFQLNLTGNPLSCDCISIYKT